MLSTVNSVKEYTGYDVTQELIKRAQGIIEIYVGKDEIDVENASDLLLLDKMVAYQTAYMLENEDVVFKQVGSTGDGTQTYNLKTSAPFIAPLAAIAATGLSWSRSKSYKTGRIFQRRPAKFWAQDWLRY